MNAKSLFIFAGGVVAGLILGVSLTGLFSVPEGTVGTAPAPVTGTQQTGPDKIKLQQEIDQLLVILKDDPQNYDALVHLGNNYFDIGQPRESIDAYRRALDINDTDPNVWTDMGIMQRRLAQYQQALESFTAGAAKGPTHPESRLNMGVVYFNDLKDLPRAVEAWKDFLSVESFGPRADEIRQKVDEIERMLQLQQSGEHPPLDGDAPAPEAAPAEGDVQSYFPKPE